LNKFLEAILSDLSLGLTATDRVILLHLAQDLAGSRIEDIARSTGSRYRRIENQVSKLTRLGILQRVRPNTYAINDDRGGSQ
jgi:predicted transcriptional regulator